MLCKWQYSDITIFLPCKIMRDTPPLLFIGSVKAGFEPATNRLTAERTTAVLLTLNMRHKKTPPGRGLEFI